MGKPVHKTYCFAIAARRTVCILNSHPFANSAKGTGHPQRGMVKGKKGGHTRPSSGSQHSTPRVNVHKVTIC